MIVDCHTHISFKADESALSEHLTASETVDACILLETEEAGVPSLEVNEKLSDYVGKYTDKMVGFGVVEPTKDSVNTKSVAAVTEKSGLKGVVVYCSACGFHPAHSRAMRFYESAEELGLPVFFHNLASGGSQSFLEYSQPLLLDEVARAFPRLKIIIGNMGRPFVEQTLCLLSKHENIYADLTVETDKVWGVYNMVMSAYENGVMDKLFFGSGFPASNASGCIEILLGFNKLLGDTNLPRVPRDNIRGVIERDVLELLGIEK